MKIKFVLLILLAGNLFMISCKNNDLMFEKRITFEDKAWKRFDVLKFDVPITDSINEYDFYLQIRHAGFYPYANLLLSAGFLLPGGEERAVFRDIAIRNSQGAFLGDGMGDLYDVAFPLKTNIRFSHGGTCHVEIENVMPKYVTEGIMDVALTVIKSNSHHKPKETPKK